RTILDAGFQKIFGFIQGNAPPLRSSSSETHEPQVFQLKVTLKGFKPPVWRRIQILDTATFASLHDVIQQEFDWENEHLHDFTIRFPGAKRWTEIRIEGLTPDGDLPDSLSGGEYREDEVRLWEYLSLERPKATYTYDFGADWEHAILLEQVFPPDPSTEYPCCITVRGKAPTENGDWDDNDDF
ncbi:MAG TPA: plasmid pRiA4b ORF-3 family protein, partial [Candidatus Lokiarchaeia archaeon]|nr:plasmid pRiA4b ORF-3 family protein [Candidatus Lokiarchaeia archaeon]